ncbi:MAG: signal recognition particle subunit SRP19/SEC65 family protein [Candidatus Sigynarchaeota archaeon]
MRNKHLLMVYPVYFDAKHSRRTGRRVPMSIAVQRPMLDELKVIADVLKLDYQVDPDAKHPASWFEEYQGRLLVKPVDLTSQKVEKAKLIIKIAKYLVMVKKKKKEKEDLKERQQHHAKGQQSHKKYQKPGKK